MFLRYLAARAHMGVIDIRARFRIWLAAFGRTDGLFVLLLAAIFAGVITGLTGKSVRAALLVGAFCYALEIFKALQLD